MLCVDCRCWRRLGNWVALSKEDWSWSETVWLRGGDEGGGEGESFVVEFMYASLVKFGDADG